MHRKIWGKMGKLNIGVIGLGMMGKNHARVYSELGDARLVAVCDSNAMLKKDYPDVNFYNDSEKMLNSEKLDAVSICTPTKTHKELGLQALRKGMSILVEKPIAAGVEEAEEMIKESDSRSLKLMVGHIERFNPVIVELKKRFDNSELGEVYKVHCIRSGPFPQRTRDVGVIVDLAIHEIDTINYLVNARIKRIYAETARRIHTLNEDMLIGSIRFENNILGVISADWLTPKKIRQISITGEKGMFVANYLNQELVFYENDFVNRKFEVTNRNFMDVIEGRATKIPVESREPLKNEISAFVRCVADDGTVPVSGTDGCNALRIARKFIESGEKHRVIEL